MSEIFHKSCYTSRSSGYKYRTFSTNTGERKRRNSKEDNTFEKKFKELKREIASRIDEQMDETQKARDHINNKFEKIDAKISSMLELQETVTTLRKDLQNAEKTLADMFVRVERLDAMTGGNEIFSLNSRRNTFPSGLIDVIADSRQAFSSTTTHI